MDNLMRTLLMGSAILVASSCAIHVGAHNSSGGDIDSVFGGINIDSGAKVGDLSSVNGGISINSHAVALDVETVNGGIDLADSVTITSAETVNGGIEAGSDLSVSKGLETVNGGISIGKGSRVGGDIETVNGDIELTNVIVEQNLNTVNGDISLTDSTVIKGDLIIDKSGSWFFSVSSDKVTITIDKSSSVQGTIHLYKKVNLEIAEGAEIGQIESHFSRK